MIRKLGAEFRLGKRLGRDFALEDLRRDFDAVFLAVGAHIAKRAYIPAGSAAKMLDAVSVLRSMEGEDKPLLGRRVVVYGGGNTALDVARTAKRLGAEESIIVYRRTRAQMPAHAEEAAEAERSPVVLGFGGMMVDQLWLDRFGIEPLGAYARAVAERVAELAPRARAAIEDRLAEASREAERQLLPTIGRGHVETRELPYALEHVYVLHTYRSDGGYYFKSPQVRG